MTNAPANSPQADLIRAPASAFLWWGLPMLIGAANAFVLHAQRADAAVWTPLLAWMSAGCALNAMRCHRLHCYISAPVLALGAAACGLIAAGWLDLGPQGLNLVLGSALLAVAASFVPEIAWRRYLG